MQEAVVEAEGILEKRAAEVLRCTTIIPRDNSKILLCPQAHLSRN